MRNLLFSTILFLFPVFVFSQARFYVSQAATNGAETGATWADAFTDLQQAISAVSAGDTLWVAAGIYKPTATTDRTASFEMKDGVALYGGFFGTEVAFSERDIDLHKTVLSGDIGVPGVRTDNSYHVVRGKALGSATLLDGFFIRDGYSYNEFTMIPLDRYGAGMLLEGGIGMADSRPVIQNCVFEFNNANEGGGLCATWHDFGNPAQITSPVNPVLRNCTFSRNTASRFGGGFYKNSPSAPLDTFVLEDCKFLDNKAFVGQGGGVYFAATANSNTVVRRCIFERDTAWGDAGGAIAYFASPPAWGTYNILLDSCKFQSNVSLEGSGFLFDGYTAFFGSEEGFTLYCRIQNCLFENNLARFVNGSAYYIFVAFNSKLKVEVEDCVFTGNLASHITGDISMYQHNESYLKVNRCIFYNNRSRNGSNLLCMALSHGGGSNCTIISEITNCLFYQNGGGMGCTSQPASYNTTHIANCTFVENNEYIFVKTWDTLFSQSNEYFNDFFIENCIIWEPATNLRKMFYNNKPQVGNMYGYRINHALLNLMDSTSVPGAAGAFQAGIIRGQWPEFMDAPAGDFRLKPCSPAVNAGSNDPVFALGIQDDLDGLPRIRYGKVDLGAYEQQDSCTMVRTGEPATILPLAVWPNPSYDGRLYFDTPPFYTGNGMIRVYDAHSREVYRWQTSVSERVALSLQHLQPGVYWVRLSTAQGEYWGKWMLF